MSSTAANAALSAGGATGWPGPASRAPATSSRSHTAQQDQCACVFGVVVDAQRPQAAGEGGGCQRGGQFGRQMTVPASRLRDGDLVDPSLP